MLFTRAGAVPSTVLFKIMQHPHWWLLVQRRVSSQAHAYSSQLIRATIHLPLRMTQL